MYLAMYKQHRGAPWRAWPQVFGSHREAHTYAERMARDAGAGAREYAAARITFEDDPTAVKSADTPEARAMHAVVSARNPLFDALKDKGVI